MKLPEGWEIKKIKDFTNVITGGTPSTTEKSYWERGNIPWLPSGDLKDCRIFKASKFITKKGLESSAAKLMPKKTVLIALTGATTGQIGLLEFEASANQSVTGILPSKEHIPEYLFYFLRSIRNKVLKQTYGGAQPHISQGFVKNIEVVLPPIKTQEEIVAILEKAEQIKNWRKEADKLSKDYLKSVFYEMFGDPIKNPKGWSIEILENVCNKITDGEHITPKLSKDGIPYISAKNVNDKIDFDEVKFVDKETYEKIIKRCLPEYGDILITCVGTIGRIKIIDVKEKFVFARSIALLKPNPKKINSLYLERLLSIPNMTSYIVGKTNEATVKGLYLKQIKNLKIPIPPLPIQQKFAKIVEQVEKMKEKQKRSKEETNQLFDSLMQKAFKGELVI